VLVIAEHRKAATNRVPNPLNPLDWVQFVQNWFTKTERSSGFRPFLIFYILVSGLSLVLLITFKNSPQVAELVRWLLGGTTAAFVLLYFLKAFQDPDFCRSERHVHQMKKLELEVMGSDTKALPADVLDEERPAEGGMDRARGVASRSWGPRPRASAVLCRSGEVRGLGAGGDRADRPSRLSISQRRPEVVEGPDHPA
jgi:hypothetical protein